MKKKKRDNLVVFPGGRKPGDPPNDGHITVRQVLEDLLSRCDHIENLVVGVEERSHFYCSYNSMRTADRSLIVHSINYELFLSTFHTQEDPKGIA